MVENGSFRNRAAACGAFAAEGAEVRACSLIHETGHLSGGERPGRGSAPTFLILENIMKRRIFSFLLAVVMVFSLAPSVFAAEGDTTLAVLTADKTSVRPGEDVTFTYTLQEQVDYIERMTIVLIYDANLFTWKSTDYEGSVFFTAPTINTADVSTGGEHRVRLVQASDDSDASVFPGKICSFTLTASEEITDTQEASFYTSSGAKIRADGLAYGISNDGFDHSWLDPIKIAIVPYGGTPIPTTTGYSVSMAADQTVAVGETVSIPVTVASSEKKITGFNAYDMTFTYDPAALTLNTASDAAANLTVEDNNGTVRVRRYGETAPLGEALTLDFTAKKGAASTVTLTEAKFDLDANSINFDAPAATIADADTKVTGLWNVTLPEGFRSAGGVNTVEDGKDFTFTAPDAHYDYVLDVTTNGNTEQVTMKGNNSYTIENVTDNVTVTEKSRTAKTYTLKFVVDDRSVEYLQREPLTLADLGITDETVEVQYPNNYEFTVKFPGTGRYFGATISPDKNRFVKPLGDVSENGDCTYTLDGSKLTGDENGEITITINVYAWQNKLTIGVGGNGAEDFAKDNALTCYPTENYTFTVNKSEYYDYTVTATYWQKKLSGYWDTVRLTVRDNGDGTYTIVRMPEIIERYELANVDVTITITKTAKAVDPDAVAAYEYVQLDGKTVVLVTVTGRPGSGKVFTYDGNAMFKANNYGWDLYSWLLILDKGEALDVDALKADVISKLALDDGTATTISQVYDVNKSRRMDINDAQLVYDIYNGTYFDFTKVSMEKFLLADVNCDKMVNSADAVVIVGQFR